MEAIKFKKELVSNTKPYYLGLDIGTSTIGYAVTDKQYNVIKKGKKSLWGVHKYYEAQTAAERRGFRSSRRNKNRRKQRINLLQEYFSEAISNVDPGFYQRMKDSFFYPEDKSTHQRFSLFNDSNFTDNDYYEKYPTIYHLRNELMESREPHDVRLVYLALHHIMKHRGHFLFEGKKMDESGQINDLLIAINSYYLENDDEAIWPDANLEKISDVLRDSKTTSREKTRKLDSLLSNVSSETKEFNKLIIGNEAKLDKLFDDESLKESEYNKINLSKSSYEENTDSYEELLGDRFLLIQLAYSLYSAVTLDKLLSNESGVRYHSLSKARIAIYNQHASDLSILKEIIRWYDTTFDKEIYADVFRRNDKTLANYVAFSGHVDSNDVISPVKRCNHTDFIAYIKSTLTKIKNVVPTEEYQDRVNQIDEVIKQIELGLFLPKITSTSNGVIPHQLHLLELSKILRNASSYLDFLSNEVIEQIEQIFTFKIPYYVGPLNSSSNEFAWIQRKSFEAIRPWNFSDVVDLDQTQEKFIRRMTNKCTYLIGEDVLPKESLLYSEYMVRSALNNLMIDGKKLVEETRDYLFESLFVNRYSSGKITRRRISSALKNIGIKVSEQSITGMDDEIPGRLKARQDFNRILNNELTDSEIESIIERITLFADSPEVINSWLSNEFGSKLTDEQIFKISKLKYKGWGRLSKKFLSGIYHVEPDAVVYTIIEYMKKEPKGLMEIINDDSLDYSKKIESHNKGYQSDNLTIDDDYLKELYLSPSVKKAVRKVSLLVQEINSIMGGAPERIFIEMTRSDQEKKKTKSRKMQIDELYQALSRESHEFSTYAKQISDEASHSWKQKKESIADDQLKSKKLYLYYRQWGRCMYTGNPINLNQLFDNAHYDIDHILPRSLTKDDSWDNLVLVEQAANRLKGDKYPITDEVRSKMSDTWRALHSGGFITPEKFNRLMRSVPLEAKDLEVFINRQLVETSQTTKQIANILKRTFSNSDIVYVKANHVSDFRYKDGVRDKAFTKFYYPKVRDLNDYHHAKDAYLNIVVGNCYHSKFTRAFLKRFYQNSNTNNYSDRYNLEKFFDREIKDQETTVWVPGEKGTITIVNKYMNRNNVLLSYEARTQRGGFFDQQLVKKGQGQHPIKSSVKSLHDFDKYGGYNKLTGSHFSIVKYDEIKKGKTKEKIEIVSIPLIVNTNSSASLIDYLESINYHNPQVLYEKVLYGQVVEINSVRYRIKGKNGDTGLTCELPFQGNYSLKIESQIKDVERSVTREKFDNLDVNTLNSLFEHFINKLTDNPFKSVSAISVQGEKLGNLKSKFESLDVDEKAKLLLNICRLLNGSGNPADLSTMYSSNGGSEGKYSGSVTISRFLNENSNLSVINTSISGFYENITKVL